MPIYEYICRECTAEFEKLVGPHVAVACPSCQSDRVTRRLSVVGIKTASRWSDASVATQGGCCGGGGCGCH